MQSFMKELSPQSFEDIVAGISLYRPGPMDFIPNYIKGKNNPKEISYVTPEYFRADLRLYSIPGTGYADSAEARRLYNGSGGQHPPCHEQEEAVCN